MAVMFAPLVVPAWAWIAGAVGIGGAAVASTPQGQAAIQQGAKAIGNAASNAASSLRDAVISEPCQNCERPDCKEINRKIRERKEELEQRHEEMRADRSKHNLFRDYRSTSTPHPNGYGSWDGHIIQYNAKQINLIRLINQAIAMKCPITVPDAEEWATRPAPIQPD